MKNLKLGLLFWVLTLVGIFSASPCFACPLIDGLVDFNCDQKLVVAAVGDSIVTGVGDSRFHDRGGYLLRLHFRFRDAVFVNQGHPGITSSRLYSTYRQAFTERKKNALFRALRRADVVIIDVGRNDYFGDPHPNPDRTVQNIQRLVQLVRSELGRLPNNTKPYVVVASLLETARSFQAPFINRINDRLFQRSSSQIPLGILFNSLGTKILGSDGLHPTSQGFTRMADLAEEFLTGLATSRVNRLRPDRDNDGVFDLFERRKFKTDPKIADTDGDGLSDGAELFTHRTDPLVGDTDGDGLVDGVEIELGTNPLIPDAPTPTPIPTLTPLPTATATAAPSPTHTAVPTATP